MKKFLVFAVAPGMLCASLWGQQSTNSAADDFTSGGPSASSGVLLSDTGLSNAEKKGQAPWGLGIGLSSLGISVQGAVALGNKLDVRGGLNIFSLSHNFNNIDGLNVNANINFRTGEVVLDYHFLGPLYIAPGILAYDGNKIGGTASEPAGQSLTLNGQQYFSEKANPLTGSADIAYSKKVAPLVMLGLGHFLPTGGGHVAFHTEIGLALTGSPAATLNLSGAVCGSQADANATPPGESCQSTSSQSVQTNIAGEQTKLNNSFSKSVFKYFPILSMGLSFAF